MATDVELEPHLGTKFWPVPILSIMGRSAKKAPKIPQNEAVWYGWRDRFLHSM